MYRGDLFKGLFDKSNIWFKKEKILQATTSLEPWKKFYSTLIWKTALDNLSRILNIFNFWTCANFNLFSFKKTALVKERKKFYKGCQYAMWGKFCWFCSLQTSVILDKIILTFSKWILKFTGTKDFTAVWKSNAF